jgi:hypothetical protein
MSRGDGIRLATGLGVNRLSGTSATPNPRQCAHANAVGEPCAGKPHARYRWALGRGLTTRVISSSPDVGQAAGGVQGTRLMFPRGQSSGRNGRRGQRGAGRCGDRQRSGQRRVVADSIPATAIPTATTSRDLGPKIDRHVTTPAPGFHPVATLEVALAGTRAGGAGSRSGTERAFSPCATGRCSWRIRERRRHRQP